MPRLLASASLAALLAGPALPQDRGVTSTFFGTPGLLEMPSAISAADGEISGTVGAFGSQLRTSFTVQVTPRFSGTFRYSNIQDFEGDGEAYFDRSFDLRYRFTDEGRRTPLIAVGLQDFLGTGVYGAEYVVATKTFGDSVRATAGLGWGRLGTFDGFSNPLGLGDRPEEGVATGGTPGLESYFRGDAAIFGGVEYAATDRLTVKLEYSSDDGYVDSAGEPLFDRASPFNVGLAWRPLPGVQLQGAYLYGSELAFSATFAVNPNDRPFGGGFDDPPQPVAVRADPGAAASWDRAALPEADLRARLQAALRTEGVELLALEVTDRAARVRTVNSRFRSEAQALGRIARILTQELPPSVETLTIEPVQRGLPLSAVSFARTDLEGFENRAGGTAASLDRAVVADAGPRAGLTPLPPVRDAFSWGLRPFIGFRVFGNDDPIQLNAGAELSAAYRFSPGLILSGAVRQRVISTASSEEDLEVPINGIPVVRRNGGLFGQDGNPTLETLTLARYGRPGPNLFSRVTVGYLEREYGGASAEVLWKPPASRLGVGVEVNYVQQRGFDQLFDFGDYDVATGHASAYLDLGNGFHTRVDAGRYLAGDWGATLAVDREWENGWRVGAYATLTEIPFEDFGEGSFDKGIRLTIPTDFIFGRPTRRTVDTTIQSLNRDGGARLDVDGRLYEVVRGGHLADLEDSWGRFWR